VWALALAVALAALFLLALSQSLVVAANSDGAANVLQAHSMLDGNPLLRGWWTSDVSFYTTELPEYALVEAARGVSLDVVHVCGALTYTIAVALAALLARGSATGLPGWRRAGLAAGMMLAPSILGGTSVFLENPDHFGTSVPVLLLFLLLDWWDRPDRRDRPMYRWYVPAAACALLAWTQVGDELSLVAATIPVAAVCAYRLLVRAVAAARGRTRGGLRAGLRADGPLLAAAIVSIGIAGLVKRAITAVGGFDLRPIPGSRIAPLGELPSHAHVLWLSIVLLFGANNPGAPGWALTRSQHIPLVLMSDLHVIGLLLAGAGLVAGIAVGFFGRGGGGERVTQLLVAAIGATLAAAVLGSMMQTLSSAHEVAILLPLAAVLAGRTLPPLAARLAAGTGRWLSARAQSGGALSGGALSGGALSGGALSGRGLPSRLRPGRVATVALAVWLAAGVAEMGYAATWPAAAVPVQGVADWLLAHHERDGLAAYWQAAQTTVTTGGRILVAPVTDSAAAPMRWNASSRWYWAGVRRATFVIAEVHPQQPQDSLPLAVVRARFGPPAAEYHVGDVIIVTYRHNLLTRLRGRAFSLFS
jgi:hypothetical protein